jgi:type 1 fimbriae regulatory protein FimB
MTAIKRVRSGPRESTKRRNVKSGLSLATDHRSRTKDYLDTAEIDLLLKAAKAGRYGTRDSLLLMMLYRHGLRVSEAISLRVTDVNLQQARLWVNRLKNGLSVEQPIPGDELRAIKRYLSKRTTGLLWLFLSERGQPLTRQSVNYIVSRSAKRAGLPNVHPHTLTNPLAHWPCSRNQESHSAPSDSTEDHWSVTIITRPINHPCVSVNWPMFSR